MKWTVFNHCAKQNEAFLEVPTGNYWFGPHERSYCKGNGEVVLADMWFLWGGSKRNVWELDNDGCTTLYLMSLNYTLLSG